MRDYVTAWAHSDYAKMYGLLDKKSQAAVSQSGIHRRIPERRDHRDAREADARSHRGALGGHDRGSGPGADTHLRQAQRDPPGPARRQRRERARAVRGRVAVPRPAPRRDAEPKGRAAAPRRHPGQRRHPAGAGTGALLADLGRRVPDRRLARADPGTVGDDLRRARGIRRTPRLARTGSSGSSSIGSPAPRAARCSPGRGRSPTPIRRRARR